MAIIMNNVSSDNVKFVENSTSVAAADPSVVNVPVTGKVISVRMEGTLTGYGNYSAECILNSDDTYTTTKQLPSDGTNNITFSITAGNVAISIYRPNAGVSGTRTISYKVITV